MSFGKVNCYGHFGFFTLMTSNGKVYDDFVGLLGQEFPDETHASLSLMKIDFYQKMYTTMKLF